MANKRLIGDTTGHLTYEQNGFDIFKKMNGLADGRDFSVLYPGEGTAAGAYETYFGAPAVNRVKPYWVGIQNCHPIEVMPVQARSVVGEDLAKFAASTGVAGVFDPDDAIYMNLAPGDFVHGVFDAVAILMPTAGGEYNIRLVRGV
jgi:hypothetical protein